MSKTYHSSYLDIEQLRKLLNLPKHAIRSLIEVDDTDGFSNEPLTRKPCEGGHTPLSASREAL